MQYKVWLKKLQMLCLMEGHDQCLHLFEGVLCGKGFDLFCIALEHISESI